MLNERSEKALIGVHPKLVEIARRASETSEVEFIITEGVRTVERQKQLFAKGATRTMESKHLIGRAFDVAAVIDGEVRWDWPLYSKIATAIKAAAKEKGVVIVWGGDWKTFKDGPHFELGAKE
jgi:peptidoglycan L-alanyl-D-glutamate endopeptidase CwlK